MTTPRRTSPTGNDAGPHAVWRPLAGELGHPTRLWLLTYWGEQTLAALDVARASHQNLNTMSYHVGRLLDAALLQFAGTRPRRGGPQLTYRSTVRGHLLADGAQTHLQW